MLRARRVNPSSRNSYYFFQFAQMNSEGLPVPSPAASGVEKRLRAADLVVQPLSFKFYWLMHRHDPEAFKSDSRHAPSYCWTKETARFGRYSSRARSEF
jgi:hypothetical protein